MRNALYPGSFDMPTIGHAWMITRGAHLFDHLTIAIADHPEKKATFSLAERITMVETMTKDMQNVTVVPLPESTYTADLARTTDCTYLLRGIRSEDDFRDERILERANRGINPPLETVYLIPPPELVDISSSFVKMHIGKDGWKEAIVPYLTPEVTKIVLDKSPNR